MHIQIFGKDSIPRFHPPLLLKILYKEFDLIEDSKNPDVVLCSIFGQGHTAYDCPKILYIGEAVSADFNTYDYIIGFDHLYYPGRYLRIPLYLLHNYEMHTVALTREKHQWPDAFYRKKQNFCAYIVSNPYSFTARDDFYRQLCTYRQVDSAGSHLKTIDGSPVEDKIQFLKKYKFNIAFENSPMDGYVTEKITDAFAAGCIPIYLGGNAVEKDFNPAAFIDISKFASVQDCIEYIAYLDTHADAYMEMIRQPAFLEEQTLDLTFEKDLIAFFHQILDQNPIPRKRPYGRPIGPQRPRLTGALTPRRLFDRLTKL